MPNSPASPSRVRDGVGVRLRLPVEISRPVPDVVACLGFRVHARFHIEILHLASPRSGSGSTSRPS